jgi:hypothetical protein
MTHISSRYKDVGPLTRNQSCWTNLNRFLRSRERSGAHASCPDFASSVAYALRSSSPAATLILSDFVFPFLATRAGVFGIVTSSGAPSVCAQRSQILPTVGGDLM